LACLPIAIAYSRFGWDQSQAPLAALLCLYFALKRQVAGAVTTFGIGLIVHPANFFLAPIVLGPLAAEQILRLRTLAAEQRRRLLLGTGAALLGLGLLGFLALWLLVPGYVLDRWLEQGLLGSIGRRLSRPGEWAEFALRYGDLLTGTTIYRYIVGPVPEWSVWLQRGLFWGLLILLLAGGLPRLIRRGDVPALGFLSGLAVSLLAFCIVLGPRLIGPALERYAMCLVTPSCIALALLGSNLGETLWARRLQLAGLLTVGGLLLAGFYQHYFLVLIETGGESHRTFRTGPVEPKQAAFDVVLAAAEGQPVTILAEDWWTFFPLYYLAGNHREIRVVFCDQSDKEPEARVGVAVAVATRAAGPAVAAATRVAGAAVAASRRRFVAGFAGRACDQWLTKHAPSVPKQVIADYAGRPLLYVWDIGRGTEMLEELKAAVQASPPDQLPQ
jgi:hypothetical protein